MNEPPTPPRPAYLPFMAALLVPTFVLTLLNVILSRPLRGVMEGVPIAPSDAAMTAGLMLCFVLVRPALRLGLSRTHNLAFEIGLNALMLGLIIGVALRALQLSVTTESLVLLVLITASELLGRWNTRHTLVIWAASVACLGTNLIALLR